MSPEPTPTERKTSAWEHATRLVTEACTPGPVAAGDVLAVANWLLAATGDALSPTPATPGAFRVTLDRFRRNPDAMTDDYVWAVAYRCVIDPPPAPMTYNVTVDGQKVIDAINRRNDDGLAKR